MKMFRSVTTIKSLAAVLCLAALTVPSNARALDVSLGQGQSAWAEYADAKQWFTIEYPSIYQVDPPIGKLGPHGEKPIGEVLTFSSLKRDSAQGKNGSSGVQIVVGFHTAQRDPAKPLEAWAAQQLLDGSTFTAAQLSYTVRVNVLDKINSQNQAAHVDEQRVPTVILEGSSPAAPEWKSTFIPYGNVVLFIWTNSRKAGDTAIYDHMVNSLRFTDKTPRTFQAAYNTVITRPRVLRADAYRCMTVDR